MALHVRLGDAIEKRQLENVKDELVGTPSLVHGKQKVESDFRAGRKGGSCDDRSCQCQSNAFRDGDGCVGEVD